MRYDAEHKQQTRERVLKAAAKAIRGEGPHKISVAAVMAEAGLTHGGFYAHFESKDAFIAAAVGQMFAEGRARFDRALEGRAPREGLSAYLDFYLSARHRDTRTAGCPLPFLSADAPRLAAPSRERFAQGVASLAGRLAEVLAAVGQAEPEETASSMLSEMVGAVALARAEPDPARSDAILTRTRASLSRRLGLETAQ
ncbi:TetR/AcrR family transcriptional regulator [soil metagenome]